MASKWFETVAVAQRRAQARLPKSVYGALVAGSEKGLSAKDNLDSFDQLGFAPHVAGNHQKRSMATTVMGDRAAILPEVHARSGIGRAREDHPCALRDDPAGIELAQEPIASTVADDACDIGEREPRWDDAAALRTMRARPA